MASLRLLSIESGISIDMMVRGLLTTLICCAVTGMLPLTGEADLLGGAILEDTPTSFVVFVDQATPTPAGRRSLNTGLAGFFGKPGENWLVVFEETLTANKIFLDVTAQHMVSPHAVDGGIGEEFSLQLDVVPGGPFESSADFAEPVLSIDHGQHEDRLVSWEYGPCGLCPPVAGQSRLTIRLQHVPEASSTFFLGFGLAALVVSRLAWSTRLVGRAR